SVEVTQAHLDRIAATEDDFGSFITVTDELALATAKDVDEKRARGEELHALAGVPVALKDLVVTEGVRTTAASKILENWVPPYESTVHNKVKDAGLPVLGKTNLDEFAMGSTTEHSAFGTT
ncbi:Asp-tRNA(Asn)/Glu-tRNA(Gln) amidotransferase GatCAB subunit A, partial [Burkholderia multivorans]